MVEKKNNKTTRTLNVHIAYDFDYCPTNKKFCVWCGVINIVKHLMEHLMEQVHVALVMTLLRMS